MGEKRQYDMMKGVAVSPNASFQDFVTVGYTPENTNLQDRDSYANDPWIQDQFKDEYGNFDRGKFNNAYDLAKIYYNNLSRVSRDEVMESQRWYHRSNPDVPVERREQGPLFQQIKMANPYEQVYGLVEFGRVEEPTKSVDELAQSHKVLSNPTTAGDNLENAKWDDAPNGHLGKYLFQTLVLATYDEDGEHIDPFTGKTVQHKKGEFKLNNDGEFYYEKLDGRSIYGKSVLNKMNILTTDGSTLNKYDFFDSDDIQPKSFLGLTAKELALVGSMFLPYVGPWITGLSVATQLAGLMGTLGKMLIDSDNAVFSQMEGFAKSWDRLTAKTQYAQEHVWCMENMISMIGDVAAQLTEQRFIFNRLPYLFTGSMVVTEEQYAARLAKFLKEAEELTSKAVKDLVKDNTNLGRIGTSARELSIVHNLRALANMDSFMKNYRKIGEVFSKGYMTAITVKDAYGDAISQGAQDMDAAILTLGYSAAEYALLSTGIGEWILPELRADRYRNQAIARALMGLNDEANELRRLFGATLNKMPKEGKMEWFNKLFNIGKNIARAEYSNGTRTLQATLAAATGEAIEEVSEEVLQDFSNSCYNIVKWLKGDDTRLSAWGYDYDTGQWNKDEMIDRYGMSFVGGFFGGGLTNIGTQYSMFHDYSKMTSQQAWEQLCYITRNGEAERFLKEIDKIELADPNLAATDADNIKGDYTFLPGTQLNNQDRAAKLALRKQIEFIQNTLNAEGANIEDDSLLDKQTLGELRFVALRNSSIARSILNEFNSKTSELLKITSDINNFVLSRADTNNNGLVEDFEARSATLNDTDKAILKKMKDDRKEIVKEINEILEGKKSHQFIRDSLFEMIAELGGVFTDVNFELYAEHKYGTKYEDLTEDQLAKAAETYKVWKEGTGRDKIITLAEIFYKMITMASDTMTNHRDTYINEAEETRKIDEVVRNLYEKYLNEADFVTREKTGTLGDWIDFASLDVKREQRLAPERIFKIFATEQQLTESNSIYDQLNHIDPNLTELEQGKERARILSEYYGNIFENIRNNLNNIVSPILKRGYVNTETKRVIERMLDDINDQLSFQKTMLWNDPDHLDMTQEHLLPEYEPQNTAIQNALDTINQLQNGYDVTGVDENGQKITNHINGIHDLDESPFWKNLNEFAISIGKEKYDIRGVLNLANSALNDVSADASKFTMDESLYNAVREAINITKMYRAAITAARTDKANLSDYFGYNATLNEVSEALGDKKKDLVEIDKSVADIFVADIDNNLNKLDFLEKLYRANQGLKLGRQDRISIHTNLLLYKRLKPIIQITDDDPLKKWKDVQKLLNALSNMQIHERLSNLENPVLQNEEERINMEKERIALEDAIYDFFLANSDAITDINKLKQFINGNRFNLYTRGDELMDENLNAIDDNAMIWWIASRAAIKSSDFHYQYAKIINPDAEHPIAPIGSLEWCVYNNYAAILNQNVFSAFTEAYRQSIREDWKGKTVEQRINLLKRNNLYKNDEAKIADDKFADYILSFLASPGFPNIVFNEGIPGSGKTTAVIRQTIELLKNHHPELLKKVAIVHGSNQKSAEDILAALGIENSKAYDKNGFMKGEIDPGYKPYPYDPKKESYTIPDTDYEITNDGEIISKLGVQQTTTPCSLIIIDEVLQFNKYDILRIQKYAKKYGITVLTSGDFDQSGVVGDQNITINGESIAYAVGLNRLNFVRSPKLGVSMRTGNTIKTKNQENSQLWLHNGAAQDITLNYFQDDTGVYGDVVFNISPNEDPNITKGALVDDVMKLVDTMVLSLEEGQKIGYIYDSDDSPIFKAIKEKYGDKIDAKKGSMALGAEARYYIVETPASTSSGFANDVYTGITRAEQASILITDSSLINSKRIDNNINETLSKSTIVAYARRRKNILEKAVPSGNEIPYTAPNTEAAQEQQLDNNKQQDDKNKKEEPLLPEAIDPTLPPATAQVNIDAEGNIKEKPLPEVENPDGSKSPETPDPSSYDSNDTPITGKDIVDEERDKEEINNANDTTQKPTPVDISKISPEEAIEFNTITHSFNSFELGVVLDKDGNIVWDEKSRKARIDGVNGLWKLALETNLKDPPLAYYIRVISELLNAFYNISDKLTLCDIVGKILRQNGIYITFALKQSPSVKKGSSENYAEETLTKFSKNKNEKTLYNGSTNEDADNIGYKQIVAIIGRENGNVSLDILEIPLVQLSSPITIMRTLEDGNGNLVFDDVNKKYWLYRDKEGPYKYDVAKAVDEIIKEFGNVPRYKNLIDLFRLFRYGDRDVAFIDDPNWTLAQQKSLGLQYVQKRGRNMDMDKFQYDAQLQQNSDWTTINTLAKNPRITMTKKIYVSSDGNITDASGKKKAVIKRGHTFILISSDTTLTSDKAIIEQYIRQQNDPANTRPVVKLIYVLKPKVPFYSLDGSISYLGNLLNIMSGKRLGVDKQVRSIGELFTSYKIWSRILSDWNSDIYKAAEDKIGKRQVQILKNIIDHIDSLEDNNARKQFLSNPIKADDIGFGNGKTKIASFLDYQLLLFTHTGFGNLLAAMVNTTTTIQPDMNIINMCSKIIGDIYYNAKIDRSKEPYCGLNEIILDNTTEQDGTPTFTIDGKPFWINGKIDTPAFEWNVSPLVDKFLNSGKPYTTDKGTTHKISDDGERYKNRNSNIWTKSTLLPKPQGSQNEVHEKLAKFAQTLVDKINLATGDKLVISDIYTEGKDYDESAIIGRAIKLINGSDVPHVAFYCNGNVYISQKSDLFAGTVQFTMRGQTKLVSIDNPGNDGLSHFSITVYNSEQKTNVRYDATFDGTNLEIIPYGVPVNIAYPSDLTLNKMTTQEGYLGTAFNSDPFLPVLLSKIKDPNVPIEEVYKELAEQVDSIDDYEEMLTDPNLDEVLNDDERSIIQELINFRDSYRQAEENDTCYIPLRIKMK